ncbi:MAG: DUF4411 family protein [Anaerohalosphaeraceae bacterium]
MNYQTYVLDANVFIEASRRYYAFDLAPGFWESLIHFGKSGQVKSIDRIKQELLRGHDELSDWVQKNFDDAFASTNEPKIIKSYKDIMNWVNSQTQFLPKAMSDFANGGDGWLVAFARATDSIVVPFPLNKF